MLQESSDNKGYVYIIINPAFPGFLKVGKTTQEPEARARELSSGSGVPAPYAVAWNTFVNDCHQVEKLIHQQLAHVRSRRDREFFAIPLKDAISVLSDIVAPYICEPSTPASVTPIDKVIYSQNESITVQIHDTAIEEAPDISFLKADDYTLTEIDDLCRAVETFYHVVLPRKIERETEAGKLLRKFKGKYTVEILEEVFNLSDSDTTGPWFGPLLNVPNRKLIYSSHMSELNDLMNNLLETGDLGWLGKWRRAGNKGIRTGVATLLIYLYSPDKYNIWLPKTHNGLLRLSYFEAVPPAKEMSPAQYAESYQRFNASALSVRTERGFVPQAMDWFLWAVEEIKSNPENRSLQAYIEGKTK